MGGRRRQERETDEEQSRRKGRLSLCLDLLMDSVHREQTLFSSREINKGQSLETFPMHNRLSLCSSVTWPSALYWCIRKKLPREGVDRCVRVRGLSLDLFVPVSWVSTQAGIVTPVSSSPPVRIERTRLRLVLFFLLFFFFSFRESRQLGVQKAGGREGECADPAPSSSCCLIFLHYIGGQVGSQSGGRSEEEEEEKGRRVEGGQSFSQALIKGERDSKSSPKVLLTRN